MIHDVESMLQNGDAKLIPWDDRYAIAKNGDFYSRCAMGAAAKTKRYTNWRLNKPVMPTSKRNPYIVHTVGRGNVHCLHMLLTETFFGKRPDGMCVRHIDGNPLNNSLFNLAYGTQKENQQDRVEHGSAIRGVDCHMTKLSEWDVRLVREMAASGISQVDISNKLGLDRRHVNDLVHGKKWAWLDSYGRGKRFIYDGRTKKKNA